MTRGQKVWLGYGSAVAGLGGAAEGCAGWLSRPEVRFSARAGVGLAVASGFLALVLKGWAVRRSLAAALATVGGMLAVRAVLVLGGLGWVLHRHGGAAGFMAGFFAIYFVLQWLEIVFVMTESKRLGERGS